MSPKLITRQDGFSLIEMLVSTTVMLTVTAGIFSLMNPSQGTFQAQPEVSDMQQRLRVSADSLSKDLAMAGGGAYSGIRQSGSLGYFFAPILPYRKGRLNEDPPGSFTTDTITIMYVPPTMAQTTIRDEMPPNSSELKVNAAPGCPPDKHDALCGFEEGMSLLIYDETGAYDTFDVTRVQDEALHLQHKGSDLNKRYAQGSKVVQVAHHTYYLRSDDVTQTYQLMHYDGGTQDVAIADNVVDLQFEYFGDPQPPTIKKPLTDDFGPWTTYGPKPPLAGVQQPPWPAGQNCVFTSDGSPIPAPRLLVLSAEPALVKLTEDQLNDGPWCPNVDHPDRFDADLFRIRKVGVVLRLQAALEALRGPASVLFRHGGTSRGGERYVPDQEVRFEVTPRNLNLAR
jgi:prepilin-type N-terminal cleavage/methylation domain-containing protein